MSLKSPTEFFDHLETGEPVYRHWLEHGRLRAGILNYGATLQDLRLEGFDHPLVLGATRMAPYQRSLQYFGANVGRVANRIAEGRATIDGQDCRLDRNYLGRHLLHGGSDGAHNRLWTIDDADHQHIRLTLSLPDGHMGFPGALAVRLRYRIVAPATLELDIEARTDAPTLCNFAHHSYYNLDGSADILDHRLQVQAEHYLPVDAELIPTGEVAPVEGTRFDFRTTRPIRSGTQHQCYDQNLCLSRTREPIRRVASLQGPKSGICMHLETTEPGLQIYDGAHIAADADFTLSKTPYGAFAGIALEPQRWPNAVHHPGFPSISLAPGETYRQVTRWVFQRSTSSA